MKIAIIGAGAVGGYFGAKLAHAGFEVNFLARGQHLEALHNEGLKVKSLLGDFNIPKPFASESIEHLGLSDLIIIGIKSWQIKNIREQLNAIMHPDSLVLPLQNGVLAAEELASTITHKQVLGGVCRIISKIESPGVINHFGATPSIVFGSLYNTDPKQLDGVKQTLVQSGIHCKVSSDIRSEIWKKFGFICTGGLMAVTRSTLGEIRQPGETRNLITELLREICLLAKVMGIDIGAGFLDRTMDFIDGLPAETTFSMARDIWEGKPSELDYLNGTVVMLGDKYQVETPVNKFVYSVLRPLELKARRNN